MLPILLNKIQSPFDLASDVQIYLDSLKLFGISWIVDDEISKLLEIVLRNVL